MTTDAAPWKEAFGGLVSAGDVIASKYRVDRVLRGGGVGVVVEAHHLQLEERVAVKFLRPHMADNAEAVERFEREARSAFKIRSEHVARVIDVGRLAGKLPYIVMEYLEGEDLADVLAERGRVSIAEAADYGVQLCAALHAAHALGIIHRDIKPENLFITPRADGSRCLKVLDFGLSKVLAAAHVAAPGTRQRALTMTGRALGTPQYMAPEQWMSASDADPRADIWAAGVIVYELIAGVPPFHAKQPAALCRMILQDVAPALSSHVIEVPPALEAAVMRCLSKQPADRFAVIDEFAVALRPFATGLDQAASARSRADSRQDSGPRVPVSSHLRVFGSEPASAAAPVSDAAEPMTSRQPRVWSPPASSLVRASAPPPQSDKATLVMDPARTATLRAAVDKAAEKKAIRDSATVVMADDAAASLRELAVGVGSNLLDPASLGAASRPPPMSVGGTTQPWIGAGPYPNSVQISPPPERPWLAWAIAGLLVIAAIAAAALLLYRLNSSGGDFPKATGSAPEVTGDTPRASPPESASDRSVTASTASSPAAAAAASSSAAQPASPAPQPAVPRRRGPPLPKDIFDKR